MIRGEILDKAKAIVTKDRETAYGSPENNFQRIAELWTAYFDGGFEFSDEDVAIMMALLKIARIATGNTKEDNYIDLAGYAACAAELALSRYSCAPGSEDE